MDIKELNEELMTTTENIATNWTKCGEIEALPQIVQTAFDEFREAIIKYLEENK